MSASTPSASGRVVSLVTDHLSPAAARRLCATLDRQTVARWGSFEHSALSLWLREHEIDGDRLAVLVAEWAQLPADHREQAIECVRALRRQPRAVARATGKAPRANPAGLRLIRGQRPGRRESPRH